MKQTIFTIKENVALTSNVYRMLLEGDTSAVTNCGQFVNIKLDGLFLRRPISAVILIITVVMVISMMKVNKKVNELNAKQEAEMAAEHAKMAADK